MYLKEESEYDVVELFFSDTKVIKKVTSKSKIYNPTRQMEICRFLMKEKPSFMVRVHKAYKLAHGYAYVMDRLQPLSLEEMVIYYVYRNSDQEEDEWSDGNRVSKPFVDELDVEYFRILGKVKYPMLVDWCENVHKCMIEKGYWYTDDHLGNVMKTVEGQYKFIDCEGGNLM